jgi:tRNA wybutosine-synthesizing protein 1
MVIKIDEEKKKKLEKAGYRVFNHSAIEICHWTKQSLLNKGECYKNKFYGIETHRCMQFSPAAIFCENRCIYCWRLTEFYDLLELKEDEVDDPKTIIENLEKFRRELLSGFGGNKRVDRKKFEEAFKKRASHYAISLSGEPTMYPKLPELIKYLKSLPETKSIFLVTNGQEPEMLEKLEKENALPTQIYLSTNAPDEETFKKVNVPLLKDAWERFNKSLEILSRINCRTIIRITLIRGINDDKSKMDSWANLIKRGNPHFVEVKSYMHIGGSMSRLTKNHMLKHEEVKEWALELLKHLPNFEYIDEEIRSRIVVLQNKERYVDRWIIKP